MNKKEMNNKGFSLVELIIVIAIMAILVGVLAPQFLKYVERSRKSTDCQNVASVITALQVYAADPNVTDKLADGSVTFTKSGTAASTLTTGNVDKALAAAGIDKLTLKSSEWGCGDTYTLTMTVTNGVPSFTEPSSMKAFSSDTSKKFSIVNGQYE